MSGLQYVYINTAPLNPLTNNTPYIHFLICLQSFKYNYNMPAIATLIWGVMFSGNQSNL